MSTIINMVPTDPPSQHFLLRVANRHLQEIDVKLEVSPDALVLVREPDGSVRMQFRGREARIDEAHEQLLNTAVTEFLRATAP